MSDQALGPHHVRVQRLRRLSRQRSARTAGRCFVVEGPKVLLAALDAGAHVESLYIAEDSPMTPRVEECATRASNAGIRVYRLGRGVLERVANTVTPQPVLGVVGFVDVGLQALIATSPLVVCADVRDPGNLGAIIRSADAAGVGGIVCTEGTADCYNPKAVRASAGAIFRTPIVVGGGAEAVLDELGGAGFRRLATMAKGGEDYASTDFKGRIAIVFGNEASGVSPTLVPHVDGTVSIPMAHEAESLNVAMAASVLLFEVARRRRFCGTESP